MNLTFSRSVRSRICALVSFGAPAVGLTMVGNSSSPPRLALAGDALRPGTTFLGFQSSQAERGVYEAAEGIERAGGGRRVDDPGGPGGVRFRTPGRGRRRAI